MGGLQAYVGGMVFFHLFMGCVWYVLDRKYGIIVYPWCFKWGQRIKNLLRPKEEQWPTTLPKDVTMGFIYNRRTRAKLYWATVFSTIQSLAALYDGAFNPFAEFVMWIVEVPIMWVGFYFGPLAYKAWMNKDEAFEAMDKLQKGELHLREMIGKSFGDFTDKVKETAGELVDKGKEVVEYAKDHLPQDEVVEVGSPEFVELVEEKSEPVEEEKSEEEKVSMAREIFNRYIKRK